MTIEYNSFHDKIFAHSTGRDAKPYRPPIHTQAKTTSAGGYVYILDHIGFVHVI